MDMRGYISNPGCVRFLKEKMAGNTMYVFQKCCIHVTVVFNANLYEKSIKLYFWLA